MKVISNRYIVESSPRIKRQPYKMVKIPMDAYDKLLELQRAHTWKYSTKLY